MVDCKMYNFNVIMVTLILVIGNSFQIGYNIGSLNLLYDNIIDFFIISDGDNPQIADRHSIPLEHFMGIDSGSLWNRGISRDHAGRLPGQPHRTQGCNNSESRIFRNWDCFHGSMQSGISMPINYWANHGRNKFWDRKYNCTHVSFGIRYS